MKTDYEELRIDCAHQSAEELALAREQAQLLFRFNQAMPMTEEYDQLMHRLFPRMGEGSVVRTPLTVVRPHCVTIGRRVTVMNGALMMAAGGITIDDDVQPPTRSWSRTTMTWSTGWSSPAVRSTSAAVSGLAPGRRFCPA